MESKDFKVLNVLMCCFGCFSPDFSPGMPRRPAMQRNPQVQVKFFLAHSFGPRYGKNKTIIGMF